MTAQKTLAQADIFKAIAALEVPRTLFPAKLTFHVQKTKKEEEQEKQKKVKEKRLAQTVTSDD